MDRTILISILSIVVLFVPSTISAQSAEWGTYHNDEFNWSIKYPNDWIITESGAPMFVRFYDGKNTGAMIVSIDETTDTDTWANKSEERWKKKYVEYTTIDKKEITFVGERAIKITAQIRERSDSTLYKCEIIFFTKNGKSYALWFYTLPSDYDMVDKKYFEPMRQSFVIQEKTRPDYIKKICTH